MGGLFAAKYLMPTVKLIQILCGVLFLSNRCVPVALLLITPIAFNILGIHLFVDMKGLPMALAIVVFLVVVYKAHWPKFKAALCDQN